MLHLGRDSAPELQQFTVVRIAASLRWPIGSFGRSLRYLTPASISFVMPSPGRHGCVGRPVYSGAVQVNIDAVT